MAGPGADPQGVASERSPIVRVGRGDAVCLLALLVLSGIVLWPVLFSGEGMAPGLPGHDGRTQWYPWRYFAAEWIGRGVLPLWNPYVLCGTPFLGNFQSAMLYPPNALFLVLPVHIAARASILLHIWLSAVFAYLLARAMGCGGAGAVVAAMTFAFGSANLLRVTAGHWGVTCAIPWLALVLLGVEGICRGPRFSMVSLGAFAVAAQILAGVPQYVFITAVAAVVFVAVRSVGCGLGGVGLLRRWGAVAAVFLLGGCLAGAQLLPGVEAALNGARSLPMRREWVEQFSLGPECVLTMIFPDLFGGTAQRPWSGRFFLWEMNAYFGIAALVFAVAGLLVARRRRLRLRLAVVAIVMLALALGRHTPLMKFWLAVPLSGMFRGSAKFLMPLQLAAALLGGLGLDALLCSDGSGDGRRLACLALAFLGAVLVFWLAAAKCGLLERMSSWISATGERLTRPGAGEEGVPHAGIAMPVLILASMAVWAFALARGVGGHGWSGRGVLGAVACLLVAVDMVHFGRLFVRRDTNFAAASSWPSGAAEAIRGRGAGYRTFVVGNPNLNDGMLEGIATLEGIEPNPPVHFHVVFRTIQGQPVDIAPSIYQVAGSQTISILRFMAVRNVVSPKGGAEFPPDWRTLETKDAIIAEVPLATSRSYVSYDSPGEVSADGRAAILRPADAGSAHIIAHGPNGVTVKASAEREGWLVLLDSYYPGWRASVDGRPVGIRLVNGCFRGVMISTGSHVVEFVYRPLSFCIGLVVSGLSLAALSGALAVRWRRVGLIDRR